uniref:head-tail connector protein n=1 Tax=Shewanella sp. TaxID=50422 RepID=UPI0040482875
MITNIQEINSELPVDLFEAKQHLMIDHDLDDDYLISLIQAATAIAENQTNRKLTLHETTMFLDKAYGTVHLPYGNTKIKTIRAKGELLDSISDYISGSNLVVFRKPAIDVEIVFLCGYTVDSCPADIKAAIKLLVATMYESRLDITFGVQQFKSHLSSTTILNKHKLF